MAAYAALVSLMYIIEQLEHHPRPPISLHKHQVQSLTQKVTFLQEFLEGYSHVAGYSKVADALESWIADAAYVAEDMIEAHIVDQIPAGSMCHGQKISSNDFYEGLQTVIEEMDSIKKEVTETKEKMGVQDQLQRNSTPVSVSLRASSIGQNTMVGFDDVLIEVMDKLTGGQLDRQIIPIVGMGGIGKTTLARNIYQNKAIMQHFDVLFWVTISQEYRMKEILLELLQERGENRGLNEYRLGDKLYKRLVKRRYLIIMDDIWDVEVWDQLQLFFPDDKNGSRIMLTTRLSYLASHVVGSHRIDMTFLDKDNSWNLFSKIVFGEEDRPHELVEIGRKIVENCKGLPLSIILIGGLLANCKHKREYWEYVEENLISVVNSEDNERCLKILYMSYNQLPVHLKPCFLYMGVFEEDSTIRVSMLIRLWVAEGFLKPMSSKSLEEIAEDYLKELINRNLILVHKLGPTGNIKYCKIHDLLRDLCLREAQKGRFFYVIKQHSLNIPEETNTQRRIVVPKRTSKDKVLDALQSMPLIRSLLCDIEGVQPLLNFRLLRIWKPLNLKSDLKNVLQFVNLRYFSVGLSRYAEFPSSIYLFWNLHTINVKDYVPDVIFECARIRSDAYLRRARFEIWKMPQLRDVHLGRVSEYYLPDPPSGNVGGQDCIVLGNLHTVKWVRDLKFGEEVVRRITNVKKLHVEYYFEPESGLPDYCLNNLEHLHKLESFYCCFNSPLMQSATHFVQNLTFPHSLKKLTLAASSSSCIHWEGMLEKIASLPLLEKLILFWGSFKGRKWKTVEGHFRCLKFLRIDSCDDLEYWLIESSHFPRLEHLILRNLSKLKEIPSEIGEIPTLKSIELSGCSDSAVISAKRILEEQEELQGEVSLQVRVQLKHLTNFMVFGALEGLASPNFQVQCDCGRDHRDKENNSEYELILFALEELASLYAAMDMSDTNTDTEQC